MSTPTLKLIQNILRDKGAYDIHTPTDSEYVITFGCCCEEHAKELTKAFKMHEFLFKQRERLWFTIYKHVSEPFIEELEWDIHESVGDIVIKIVFDQSITKWCEIYMNGEEDYQEKIEAIEQRVMDGIFGHTRPEKLRIDWKAERILWIWMLS